MDEMDRTDPHRQLAKSSPTTTRWRDVKTDADRWRWHAEVYAFRRVMLGIPYDVHTSPPDPDGKWYHEEYVTEATLRFENQYKRRQSEYAQQKPFTFTDEELSERALWAAGRGYRHWNDFLDAVQAGRESIKPFVFWYIERHPPKYPLRVGSFFRFTPKAAE